MNRKKSSKAAAVIDIGSNMIKMGISQIQKEKLPNWITWNIRSRWGMRFSPREK